MLQIKENVPLKDLTTMQVGGEGRYFAVVKDEADLHEAFAFVRSRKLPIFVLGGGSNLLISDHGYSGLIIKNEIKGIKFIDQGDDKVILEVGAGELWDDVVALSVIRNLSGLENLSGIPGTVGGAAVQNAGAYGAEFSDHLIRVEGLNSLNGKKFVFKKKDCQYGYRTSFFKKNKKYIITSGFFVLNKKPIFNIEYAGLKNKLADSKEITVQKIREAVISTRAEKLPDWHKIGTAGSFFMNPLIDNGKYEELKKKYQALPGFPDSTQKIKVPLAWILDNVCNLKGYRENNIGLYDKQPIVLVNYGGGTQKEIDNFSEKIKNIVKEKTGIEIHAEVEKV